MIAQRRAVADRAQPVLTQAGGVIIGVPDRRHIVGIDGAGGGVADRRAGFAAIIADVGIEHRLGIVGRGIVPFPAQAVDHVHRHVLIVLLAAVGIAQPAIQLAVADRDHDLGIDHMLVLRALALPLVGRAVSIGDIAANAVGAAHVQPGEGAPGLVAAIGEVALRAQRIGRVDREGLDRAAQIAGRLGAERTRALRHADGADILAADGAGDMQAVMIAIAHVAQRNAVEGEAELVLVEAADADALRPFIAAERIGRLEIDAGQLLDRFERIGAGRQGDEL